MALISFILTVIYILTASFWDIMVDMKQSLFTPWHLSILVATVGTLSIICLSTAIDFPNHIKRAFIWLGKNSLTIMLIHFIYITVFGYGLQLFFSLNTFYYGLAINVIIWPIIYISVMIINKYIPWIISKKKEQNDKN